ncbi:hypothetical protein P8C59_006440 [Phyllachora maydis]|uniref:Uncharacterized protein n=1 Tax=Phyllachora maydis TaxID=1825666 RepID=A0AAD9MFI4_9PEZI|nr:hypothetical protein P8C59_006440 [Phyllachora maydis]
MADQAKGKGTSNLDPPIDIGSKEGFKDTITSSIVKELSKKTYTIPDDSKLSREKNPDISNTHSDSNQAVILILLCNSLSSSPRAAISNPAIEAYRAAYVANSSNSTPHSNSNPSKKGKNKKKAIEEEEEESVSSSNSSSSSDSNT